MADILDNNSTTKQQVDYYIGFISEIVDPLLYEIKVNVPGHFDGVRAFPTRNNIDEPRVGDFVILRSFDPIYHSFFLWEKTKENDFIGFRSNGKQVDITPDYIEISIFDPEEEWYDDQKDEKYRPERKHWVRIDKDGNCDFAFNEDAGVTGEIAKNVKIHVGGDNEISIDGKSNIHIKGDNEISIDGNSNTSIQGNSEIKISGNATIKASGNVDLESPNVTVHGGILQTQGGQCAPSGIGGFCAIPVCPLSGAPHVGNQIVNT